MEEIPSQIPDGILFILNLILPGNGAQEKRATIRRVEVEMPELSSGDEDESEEDESSEDELKASLKPPETTTKG